MANAGRGKTRRDTKRRGQVFQRDGLALKRSRLDLFVISNSCFCHRSLLYKSVNGCIQFPAVLWGNVKRRQKNRRPLTSPHLWPGWPEAEGDCIPFQSAKARGRPAGLIWAVARQNAPAGAALSIASILRRICHASPARGVFQTADGLGCIAPPYRLPHTAGTPPQVCGRA